MQLGMIGLGRMGANMVRRLGRAGHDCVVYDVAAPAVQALAREDRGAPGAPLRRVGPCATIPPGSRSFRPQRREETVMRRLLSAHVTSCLLLALALIVLPGCLVSPARADLMVVGNDQKVVFDAEGNRSFVAPLPGQPASMRGRAR